MKENTVVGILGAMEIEIEEFKNIYTGGEIEKYAGFEFYIVNYKEKKLIIGYSKVGKVFSTMAATIMIMRYKIEYLIFSGIAGALNESYKVLDICVASKACQHDIDITQFGHPKGFITGAGGVYVDSSAELIEKAKKAARKIGININEGIIATGDQFISSSKEKKLIKKEFSADMIEMEGGSVATVAKQFDIPFIITRTISDSANGDGLMEFNEFVGKAAKKNSNFVSNIVEEI